MIDSKYDAFRAALQSLLQDITAELSSVSGIQSRLVTQEALTRRAQLLGKEASDLALHELSNLIGLHVTVFKPSELLPVADVLKSHFKTVNWQRSGQGSGENVVITATLTDQRAELPEWRRFAGLNFEIRLRTKASVAWSDVQHAITYKADARPREDCRPYREPRESDLILLDRTVDRFVELVSTPGVHEKRDIHPFLKDHPFLLHPNAAETFSEVAIGLGTDFKMDFMVREPDGAYLLIELENPNHNLFTAAGDFTAAVNHAQRQVEDWQQWIDENLSLMQKRYPDILSPRGLIVIGRNAALSPAERSRLARRNINLRGSLSIKTYDDVIGSVRQALASTRNAIMGLRS